jgi:hypothetical protein
MGLYKEKIEVNPKLIMVIAGAIILIVFLGTAYVTLADVFKPNAIHAQLDKNPLELSKGEFTKLKVTVTNVTAETGENVFVTVTPIATAFIIVDGKTTNTKNFGIIASGENRQDEFLIRNNPGRKVLAGNYKLQIETTINDETFKQEVLLTVQ